MYTIPMHMCAWSRTRDVYTRIVPHQETYAKPTQRSCVRSFSHCTTWYTKMGVASTQMAWSTRQQLRCVCERTSKQQAPTGQRASAWFSTCQHRYTAIQTACGTAVSCHATVQRTRLVNGYTMSLCHWHATSTGHAFLLHLHHCLGKTC